MILIVSPLPILDFGAIWNIICVTFQSETFVTLDCIYIDKCTQSDHANWNNTNNFTWNDNACTITSATSLFPRILTELTGDFTVLFNASMSNPVRLIVFESSNVSNQNKWIMTQTDELLYRIQRINGEWAVQHSTDDGMTWSNPYTKSSGSLTTETVYFGFGIETSTSRSITFHDLKAYPI